MSWYPFTVAESIFYFVGLPLITVVAQTDFVRDGADKLGSFVKLGGDSPTKTFVRRMLIGVVASALTMSAISAFKNLNWA